MSSGAVSVAASTASLRAFALSVIAVSRNSHRVRLAHPAGPVVGLEVIFDNCYSPYQIPTADFNCRDRSACPPKARRSDWDLKGERPGVNTTIMLFLIQDGIT